MAVPADEFDWYPVSREVNRVGNSDPHLIEPVELDERGEPAAAPGQDLRD